MLRGWWLLLLGVELEVDDGIALALKRKGHVGQQALALHETALDVQDLAGVLVELAPRVSA